MMLLCMCSMQSKVKENKKNVYDIFLFPALQQRFCRVKSKAKQGSLARKETLRTLVSQRNKGASERTNKI